MYAKTVTVDGTDHLVFVTRVAVRAGQELTFNYRFQQVRSVRESAGDGTPNDRAPSPFRPPPPPTRHPLPLGSRRSKEPCGKSPSRDPGLVSALTSPRPISLSLSLSLCLSLSLPVSLCVCLSLCQSLSVSVSLSLRSHPHPHLLSTCSRTGRTRGGPVAVWLHGPQLHRLHELAERKIIHTHTYTHTHMQSMNSVLG